MNAQDFPSAESQAALFASHVSALRELYKAGDKKAYNIRRPDDIVKAQQVAISDSNIIHPSSREQILRQYPRAGRQGASLSRRRLLWRR